ncbi:hypothetical protein [Arthrobacter sp. ES3-54]|uniref:hypothetical protein n=1 Tax=Arthrobacter sp. ES3-54 TaxID=1502991 RepID=UPI0024063C32|nr:hypothetical protein [Arthrobacter sp. ES3-54]MDF9748685.1 hypothetical protein [Arthrobacter sp. ES3-54]
MSENQVIPEAAVEAAAKAAYGVKPVELFGDDEPVPWEHLGDSVLGQAHKVHELKRAKQALEAAAPYLIASQAKH